MTKTKKELIMNGNLLNDKKLEKVVGGARPGGSVPGIAAINDCDGANSNHTECISPAKKGSLNNCTSCKFNK